MGDSVRTHFDLVRRFALVMNQTARWALILATYAGISPGDLVHRVHYHDKLDPAKIQPPINAAAKYGTLKAPFAASEIIAAGL